MSELAAIAEALLLLAQTQQRDVGDLYFDLAAFLSPSLLDDDTVTLARAIQGEGAAMFGERRDEVAYWIAHTAINRWEVPRWRYIDGVDCTFASRVEYDWHGTVNVSEGQVEPWALRIAQSAIRSRRRGGIDRANGALFALSLDDLLKHEWREQALDHVVHVVIAPDDLHVQFWFLDDWPEKGDG